MRLGQSKGSWRGGLRVAWPDVTEPISIYIHKRTSPRIGKDTRPVDEAQRVGLGVPARGGVVVAMPIVGQTGLDEEDLPVVGS